MAAGIGRRVGAVADYPAAGHAADPVAGHAADPAADPAAAHVAEEPRFQCDRSVRIYQFGFSERPRDAARARRAQLRETLSLRSDLEQSRRHIVEHRYEGELGLG